MSEWPVRSLGDICENLDKQRIPITKNKRVSGKYPYYGASGIVDYVDSYLFDEELLLVSEDGANLLARTYPIAFSIVGKNWVNNHAHVLRFPSQTAQRFIELYLNSIRLETYVSGMAQPKLNQKSLNSIPVPVPPLAEQERIVAILDEAFEGLDTATAHTQQKLQNAQELFQSTLQSAFGENGELKMENEEWVETTLEEVLESQPRNGWSPPAANHSDAGTPVLTLSSVTGFEFRKNKIKYTSIDTDPTRHYWVNNGELLITRSNTPELVGHVAIAEGIGQPTIYPDLIMRMVPDPSKADTKFLYYQLRTPTHREIITGRATGANPTMKKINKAAVQTLPISLPPLPQQRAIVAKLDALSAETRRLETLYQTQLTAYAELKQSLLHQAFSGKL